MTKVTHTTLMDDLDELAAFEPNGFPFISLYLNLQPDQHGRDHFMPFVRKEFTERAKSFPQNSLELASFKLAATRIMAYLRNEVRPLLTASRFLRAQVPMSISRPCSSMPRFNNTGCTSVNGHTSTRWHE